MNERGHEPVFCRDARTWAARMAKRMVSMRVMQS